jgi:hypothetical protein
VEEESGVVEAAAEVEREKAAKVEGEEESGPVEVRHRPDIAAKVTMKIMVR